MRKENLISNPALVRGWWLASAVAVLPLMPASSLSQTLSLGQHAARPGTTVTVPVSIGNAAGMASASFVINYDAALLALTSVTNGSLGQSFTVEFAASAGTIRVAAVRDSALISGSGGLILLTFRVNDGAQPGLSSPLIFADRRLGGQYGRSFEWSNTVTTVNGSVQVVAASTDSNANGLPDWWEDNYFGDPTSANPLADPDGDGLNNLKEYQIGADPFNAASPPRIQSVTRSAGVVTLRFLTIAGRSYNVDKCETLGVWTNFVTNVAGTGGLVDVTDPATATTPRRYYRLQLNP